MKNKGIIRNICMDILIHTVLICRFCNMENTILNNVCKFLPLLFSFLVIITFMALISFIIASIEPKFKAKIFNDKSMIETFLEVENNKKIKIYHKITNCTLSILLILNWFIGTLGIYLLSLLFLSWSKFAFKELIKQNAASPQVFEEYKNKLMKEQSLN